MSRIDSIVSFLGAARRRLGGLVLAPYVAGTEIPHLSGSTAQPIEFGHDPLSGYRSELIASLAAFRRRLWLYRTALLVLRTTLLAASVSLFAGFLDVAGVVAQPWWLTPALGLLVLLGLYLILWQRLTCFDVARVVDRQLGLKAQLGTAVQLTLEGQATQIARSQVRQATTIARRLEPAQAVAFRVPWRDLRRLAVVVAASLLIGVLSDVGFRAPPPEPSRYFTREDLDPSYSSWYDVDPALASGLVEERRQPTGLTGLIEDLKRKLDKREITPSEFASQVAAAEDQVRQQAAESERQQAALTDLAEALGDASITRSVAESLFRGDYAQAVQELADLSANAERLSPQARRELADRLSQAADRTAGSSGDLSAASRRAADALRLGDARAAQESLRELASAMASASQAVSPQADLGDALEQLREAGGSQNEGNGEGDPGGVDANGVRGGPGEEGDGAGQGQAQGQGGASGGRGVGDSSESGQGKGGGAGTGKGERIVTYGPSGQRPRPDPTGNVLSISGKASSSGSRVRSEGIGTPLTNTAGGTTTMQASTGAPRSSEPVSVTGEANYVPLEKKPVVKDYFTASDRP